METIDRIKRLAREKRMNEGVKQVRIKAKAKEPLMVIRQVSFLANITSQGKNRGQRINIPANVKNLLKGQGVKVTIYTL